MAETDWTDNPGDPSATDEETLDATEANDVNPEPADVDAVDQEVQDILSGEEGAEEDAFADAVADEQELAEEMDEEDRLRKQVEETTDDLKRVTAEYANYRRRVERDRVAVADNARADVADKLLPLMDDLQLAESHGDLTGPLKSTYDKLQAVLGGLKVEAFGDEGDEFNPDLHEAVQDTSSGEVKVLGTVLRKGYRLGDRVLRTALVIITDQQ
ncbi:nucleotide exchange factor GrpE [Corynebacterium dentalis]|uniref:nucleotide exchange factor GrpE n=1 Tax=Corynebacterium dentalis TaxID=2014528 RepID=UPI000C07E24C|nr:nucleotide exchange factor GrpE [Corynebacterium dentalis]